MWDRTHKAENKICKSMSKRPLIFIGHSYGGLVIKQAMVCAARCRPKHPQHDDFQLILTSISGIIYLGTPHDGSSLAQCGVFETRVRSALGYMANPKLLKPLELGSATGELSKLQANFQEMRCEDQLADLQVFHFWETEPCKIGPWEIMEVVGQHSACLGALQHECMPLSSGHKNMNKFANRDESNYKKVRDRLRIIYEQSKDIISRRFGRSRYGGRFSGAKFVKLRNWLDPMKSTDSREDTLRRLRFEGTCEWATRLGVISRWLDPNIALPLPKATHDGRCLWIYGKPGSGKSVLSACLHDKITVLVAKQNKHAIGNVSCPGFQDSASCAPALEAELWTALYFPFHSSATFTQAVVTLVHRVLLQHPENEVLHEAASKFQNKPMTLHTAMDLLTGLIRLLSLTYIVIDGLDECAQTTDGWNQYEETEGMMKFLQRLSELRNVRLLILSRRDRILGDLVTELLCSDESMIDMAAHNNSDIKLFIDIQISNLAETRPLFADLQKHITSTIAGQSRGMFQWVKLVIQQLKVQRGDKQDIVEALDHFPADLNDAYQKTFDRLCSAPGYKKDRAILALKWLACTKRTLTIRELRTAIEMHEKFRRVSIPEAEDVEILLTKVAEIEEDTLEDYFSKLLGPLAEFHRHDSIVNVVDASGKYHGAPTAIRICHHSLTQLLLTSSQPDGFNFPERAAHFLAAETCMMMMCAPRALEKFVKHFHTVDDGDDHNLLLDYAVEHWSSHLRTSGMKFNEKSLTDLAIHILGQSLDSSLLGVGALSEACTRLTMARVDQMMQAIAIRDCQAMMLPSVDSIVKTRQLLPRIGRELRKIHDELDSLGRLKRRTAQREASNQDGAGTSKEANLNSELDSTYMVEIFSLTDADPGLLQTIREQLEDIRETSRNLRALAIKLSVDPIRAWLQHLIGDHGLNPIPLLALTAHALDVVPTSFLLPATTHDRSDFREQFSAKPDHPLYGFILSARNELNENEKKVLSAVDYKNVLDRYLLKKSQWYAVHLTSVMLWPITAWQGYSLTSFNQRWHVDSLMIAYEGEIYDNIRSSDPFDSYGTRHYKKGITTFTETMDCIFGVLVVFSARILIMISPSIGLVMSNVIDQIQLKAGIMKPWIVSLVHGWRHSGLALLIYLLRLNYFFWLFSYPRKAPWTDLKGIFSDPFNYQTTLQQAEWTILVLIIAQELFVRNLLTYDVFESMMQNKAAGGQYPHEPLPLYRRISFRLGEFGPSLRENIATIATKILRHAREVVMALARMIFIERTIYEVSYIIFDILQITVQLLSPSSWSLSRLLHASYTIFGQVILTWCLQRMGFRGTLRFFWHLYLDYRRAKLLWYLITNISLFRNTIIVPSLWIWNMVKMPFVALFSVLRWSILSMAHFVSQAALIVARVAHIAGPTILVMFTAILLVLFFTVFIVLMTDPLQLRRAAYSCNKARKVAAHATGENHPLRALHWKAGGLKRIESVPLVDLNKLDRLGAKSSTAFNPTTAASRPETTRSTTSTKEAYVDTPLHGVRRRFKT